MGVFRYGLREWQGRPCAADSEMDTWKIRQIRFGLLPQQRGWNCEGKMTKHFKLEFDYEIEPARCGNLEMVQVRLPSGRVNGIRTRELHAVGAMLTHFFDYIGFEGEEITETASGITVRLK